MQTVLLSYLYFYELILLLTIVPLGLLAHYYPNIHHYQFGLLIIPDITILVVFELITKDYLAIHILTIYFLTCIFLLAIDYKDVYYVLIGRRSIFDMDRRLRKYYDKLIDRSMQKDVIDSSQIEQLDYQN